MYNIQPSVDLLELAHTACLRRIAGTDMRARHRSTHIRQICGTEPLAQIIIKRTFRWLGHVMRMEEHRLPKVAFNATPVDGMRGRGRPKGTFRNTYESMLKRVAVRDPKGWLSDMQRCASDREAWKSMVKGFTFSTLPRAPTRVSLRAQGRQPEFSMGL